MISLNKHSIEATIINRYASVIYSFSFVNGSKNGSSELKFEITIDSKAFISKFVANIDGILFIGKTTEKESAKKEYAAAKEKNENAILISQPYDDIPNVFCIKTNIDSKSKIILKISIEQYLQKRLNFNELTIQILRNFERYNIKKKYSHIAFRFNVNEESDLFDVTLPQHSIIIEEEKKRANSCLICGKIDAQKSSLNELTLKYKTKGEQSDSVLLYDDESHTFCHIISDIMSDCAVNDEKDIFEGYQVEDMKQNASIPRRVVFVIDRSGSMRGDKWNKTIASTICALKQLRTEYDRYAIIYFDAQIECNPSFGLLHATKHNVTQSIANLKSIQPAGATNINSAILTAIERIKTDIVQLNDGAPNEEDILSILYGAKSANKVQENKENLFMNQVIVITDGEPNAGETDTHQIVSNVIRANDIRDLDRYSSKISIFCFGIAKDGNDSSWIRDLNHSFLRILSVNNYGFYKRIKETNTDQILNEYFDILSAPILTNIDIRYNDKYVTNLTQTRFHSLYSGNDLIICGKIDTDLAPNVTQKGLSLNVKIFAVTGKEVEEANKTQTKAMKICKLMNVNNTNRDSYNERNIQRIWAYLKLQQFAERKLIRNDMIEYDEEERKNDDALPLKLAMKYKFVTPWSSMIVVKKKDKKYKYAVYDEGSTAESDDGSYAKQKKKKKKRKKNKGPPSFIRANCSKSVPNQFETSFDPFAETLSTSNQATADWNAMDLFGSSASSNPFIESSASNPFATINSNPFRDENPFRDREETKSATDILSESNAWNPFAELSQMEEKIKRMKSRQSSAVQVQRSLSVDNVLIVPVAQPLEAYNKNGVKILFRFISSNKENICRISAEFTNHTAAELSDVSFKVAVPKYIKLQIKPASDTVLRPFARNKIKQSFQLLNTKYGQKPYVIKIQISYKKFGKEQVDQTKVELPQ